MTYLEVTYPVTLANVCAQRKQPSDHMIVDLTSELQLAFKKFKFCRP